MTINKITKIFALSLLVFGLASQDAFAVCQGKVGGNPRGRGGNGSGRVRRGLKRGQRSRNPRARRLRGNPNNAAAFSRSRALGNTGSTRRSHMDTLQGRNPVDDGVVGRGFSCSRRDACNFAKILAVGGAIVSLPYVIAALVTAGAHGFFAETVPELIEEYGKPMVDLAVYHIRGGGTDVYPCDEGHE